MTTAGSVSLSATTVTIKLPMRMVDYTTTYLDSLPRESMIDTVTTPTVRIVYLSNSYCNVMKKINDLSKTLIYKFVYIL